MTIQSVKGPVAIKNVAAFMAMTMRLIERAEHLPGFAVCSGPSGFGKTYASIFAQNKTRAIRVEVGDTWTRRKLVSAIMRELGEPVRASHTLADLADKAIELLGDNPNRPLIIDEADKLVDKNIIETVRELVEASGVSAILIGEEKLPTKLLSIERVHNRVLDWFQAQPCDLDDARELAKAFLQKVKINDDLLDAIRLASGGRARRIVVNLAHVAELARNKNLGTVDLKTFGQQKLFTGEPPRARNIDLYDSKKAVA